MDITPWKLFICLFWLLKGVDYCLLSAVLPRQGISTLNGATNSNNPGLPVDDIQLPNAIDVRPSIHTGECPTGWQIYPETGSCYRNFQTKLTYLEAQDQCTTLGGFLATVATESELSFITRHEWQPGDNEGAVHYEWWMGYLYIKNNNTAEWEVADQSAFGEDAGRDREIISKDRLAMGTSVSPKDERLCGQLTFGRDDILGYFSQMYVQQCSRFKSAFLCKRFLSDVRCVDNKGKQVDEGQRYTPQGADNCMNCSCALGEPSMCRSAQCAPPPDCIHTVKDPDKCCAYTCVDDDYPKEDIFDFSNSMRWVLTSATSFLILGLLLFMVHRLRQRRMALIHYTSGNGFHHRGAGLRLDSGSSLTPPSPMDDIDAGIYREPPPPYSLYKAASPGEEPPPPYDTTLLLDDAPTTPTSTTEQDAALLSPSPQDRGQRHMQQSTRDEPDSPNSRGALDEVRENVPMLPMPNGNNDERVTISETRA